MKHYRKFFFMIGTSMLVIYPLMYLNSYSIDHVYWSETRAYMTLLMGASMATIMLLFMREMLKNVSLNLAILSVSALVFGSSLYLVRSQQTVDDLSWLRSMIPHHSIAILTSTRAHIKDPMVRQLADQIIESQRREIHEMQQFIDDLKYNRPAQATDLANTSH